MQLQGPQILLYDVRFYSALPRQLNLLLTKPSLFLTMNEMTTRPQRLINLFFNPSRLRATWCTQSSQEASQVAHRLIDKLNALACT